jgi:uncharacterized protein
MPQTIKLNSKLQSRLGITVEQLIEFCQRWQVAEFALFGSVLRDDFHVDSDIDILVVFDSHPQFSLSLMDLVKMEQELESMCRREVDLIEKFSVENSHNWIRRKNILNTVQVIYESGRVLST